MNEQEKLERRLQLHERMFDTHRKQLAFLYRHLFGDDWQEKVKEDFEKYEEYLDSVYPHTTEPLEKMEFNRLGCSFPEKDRSIIVAYETENGILKFTSLIYDERLSYDPRMKSQIYWAYKEPREKK